MKKICLLLATLIIMTILAACVQVDYTPYSPTLPPPCNEVSGVNLNISSRTIEVGSFIQLLPIVTPLSAVEQNVTWHSSNSSVAIVSEHGRVTGVSDGVATITATTVSGGFIASAVITVGEGDGEGTAPPVNIPVTGITLTHTNITLDVGGRTTLHHTIQPANASNREVRWSSNSTAVTVNSQTGEVVAVRADGGTATITVETVDGSFRATATVNVRANVAPPVTLQSISFVGAPGGILLGSTANLTDSLRLNPTNATPIPTIVWQSSNNSIATVDNAGRVTAHLPGTVVITAIVQNNTTMRAYHTIVVPEPESGNGDNGNGGNGSGPSESLPPDNGTPSEDE